MGESQLPLTLRDLLNAEGRSENYPGHVSIK